MRRTVTAVLLASCSILILFALPGLYAQQFSGVTAEAFNQANLRATTDVNSVLLGQIVVGTRYPVIGRSEFFPWVLLGDPASGQPIGWVFADLVAIQGDINRVPLTTQEVGATAASATSPSPATLTRQSATVVVPTLTATVAYRVTGTARGEINVRYGPGVDYPRIGVAQAGVSFEITRWHTQFPWVQIRYPDASNGFGWVATELLDIEGDLFSLPSVSQVSFELPTLTPTPPVLQASALAGATPIPLSPAFAALGSQVWNIVLQAGFEPETSKTGALFLMDLRTGEAITFGNSIAFSGTSINKVAILADLYRILDTPPNASEAADIANTMICSENAATNRLLSIIGGGDEYLGADRTTEFLSQLGFTHTFLTAPYVLDPNNVPTPPRPIRYPKTDADQVRARPDPSNQMTVDDMGWLLGSIYQCAYQDGGPLVDKYPGAYTASECRQMLHVMSNNTVDALLKAGVPADTRVAHKHGWIADTHGNAAVFFTPGGDYVIVMMLYNPDWLDFTESLPVIAEVSRAVYNYYNPQTPMEAIRTGYIPTTAECNFTGSPLVRDLMSPTFDQ